MQAVSAGARVIFEASATRLRPGGADRRRPSSSRKTRTLAGNYQLLRLEPRLLVPFVNPVWFQFVSHKLGRLVVPYALVRHAGLERGACRDKLCSTPWRSLGQLAFYGLAVLWRGARSARRQAAPQGAGTHV